MGSIRLFGRGKGAPAADAGGAGLGAARIAEVLEGLTTASMSTTWRCRHGAGVSIGEGAVDFATRRSRATVIRGKYAFEYVREGASVLRTPVTDTDVTAPAAAPGTPAAEADEEPDEDESPDEETDPDLEAEADAEFEDSESDGDEADGDEEDVDADSDSDSDSEDDADAESEAEPEVGERSGAGAGGAGMVAWERFSDHDACGVHAYAEPSVLAAGVRASGVVQPREAQEFDGVLLSAYAVTLKPKPGDPNKVLARLARQLRDHGANVLVVTAFVDESGEAGDEAEPRIVRVRIELPHWTPADDPTADHTVSVDLFEFDEAASIEVPDGAGATRRASRSCADLALF